MHRDTAAAAAAEADSTTTQNENQVDSTFQESLQNLQKALGLDQLDSDVDRELEDEELANLFEHAKRLAENSRKQAAENLAKEANEENKKLKEHRKSQNPKKALGLDHLESERLDQEIEDDELSHIFKHAKRVAENSRRQAAQDLAKQANEEHNTAHNQAHAEHLKTHFEQHNKEQKKQERSLLDDINVDDFRLDDLALDYETSFEEEDYSDTDSSRDNVRFVDDDEDLVSHHQQQTKQAFTSKQVPATGKVSNQDNVRGSNIIKEGQSSGGKILGKW